MFPLSILIWVSSNSFLVCSSCRVLGVLTLRNPSLSKFRIQSMSSNQVARLGRGHVAFLVYLWKTSALTSVMCRVDFLSSGAVLTPQPHMNLTCQLKRFTRAWQIEPKRFSRWLRTSKICGQQFQPVALDLFQREISSI